MTTTKLNGHNTLLVAVNPEEKFSHVIDTPEGKKSLFIYASASEDNRLSKPTFGRVLCATDEDTFVEGDGVAIHHNAIMDNQEVMLNEVEREMYGLNEYEKVYRIIQPLVFFIIRDGGFAPLYPYAIVERLYHKERVSSGGIILNAEREKIKNKVLVKKLPDELKEFEGELVEGDILAVCEKSDYEVKLKINNKLTDVIRINLEADVLGLDLEMTEQYSKNKSIEFA